MAKEETAMWDSRMEDYALRAIGSRTLHHRCSLQAKDPKQLHGKYLISIILYLIANKPPQ
jgi:hypothetical protein